jgi:dTDP-4-dehydrorhamnose reductase
VKPSVIYHCAAYTAVDAAEDEGKELNYKINVTGTENMLPRQQPSTMLSLVYISTDYVFERSKTCWLGIGSR